jgi:soluble lytic murein transglycosylase-like protein
MFTKITFRWFFYFAAAAVTWPSAQAQVNPSIAPPQTLQSPERCIPAAAAHHRIDPRLLRAVLKVESDLRPWAVGRNANGTVDMGMAQINSIHLPELARHGIQSQHLFDPCVASYVAAWLLRKNIDRHGLTWHGVAAYHSLTPEHNQRYQGLLMKALYPDGVASKRAPTAVKSASTTAQAVASTSASASANTSGNVNVLAYRSPNSHAAPSTARQADAWPTLLAENL